MKRLSAILLLGIFSFNLFGYRLVASFLENRENTRMELAFDGNNYSDTDLVSIKQPTNLPYYQNSADFQRVDGEIEIGGISYKYVKCRIFNDSLELLCIPNKGKMKIQAVKDDFSKLAADLQQNTTKKKSSESKSFQKTISDFEEYQNGETNHLSVTISSALINRNKSIVNNLFTKSVEQPPDLS